MTVNGRACEGDVEPRHSLADFLRDTLGLTGTHLGCEHGVCGACTIAVDGRTARACLMLAVQADGADVETIEGLAPPDGLDPIQEAFWEQHALQCGFCTPGLVMTARELLADNPEPTVEEIREGISGNLCRCTGYATIVAAIESAAAKLRERAAAEASVG